MQNLIKKIKDKCKFGMLYQIVNDSNVEICTDNNDYFMARSDENHPVWIWTKNSLTKNKIKEIEDNLARFFIKDKSTNVTCTKEFYDILKSDNYKYLNEDYFEMGTYFCKKLIEPPKVKCQCRTAKTTDITLLTKFNKDDRLETHNKKITEDESYKEIEEVFNCQNKEFLVLENENKKIVSMLLINRNEKFGRINFVYTPKDERCKNYAKNLVYIATKKNYGRKVESNYLY